MKRYSFFENSRHVQEGLNTAREWHESLNRFKTEAIKAAYEAGYLNGAQDQRNNYRKYAGIELDNRTYDQRVTAMEAGGMTRSDAQAVIDAEDQQA